MTNNSFINFFDDSTAVHLLDHRLQAQQRLASSFKSDHPEITLGKKWPNLWDDHSLPEHNSILIQGWTPYAEFFNAKMLHGGAHDLKKTEATYLL